MAPLDERKPARHVRKFTLPDTSDEALQFALAADQTYRDLGPADLVL